MLQVFLAAVVIVFFALILLLAFTRKSTMNQLNEKPKTIPKRPNIESPK